jgi:uncharacterized protein (DUF1697 family)
MIIRRTAGPHDAGAADGEGPKGRRVALVVFLRGVNVGGHRTFRPSTLVPQLAHLDAVNIGAAGTFVIRRPISRARLRAEFTRRLPFEAEIAICQHREISGLLSRRYFSNQRIGPDVVRFVSVLTRASRAAPTLPLRLPATGPWLVQVLARERRLVVGLYRRQMQTIRYLRDLDRVFGVPVITRNWKTMTAIGLAAPSSTPR